MRLFKSLFSLVVLALAAVSASAQSLNKDPYIPDYDARSVIALTSPQQAQAKSVIDQRNGNIASFLSSAAATAPGMRIVTNPFGLPKMMMRDGATLTPPAGLAPVEIAKNFLRGNTALFALSGPEIDQLRLVFENTVGGATFLAFNQTIRGVDVFEGQVKFTLAKGGGIVSAGAADLVPGAQVASTPRLTAEQAVEGAMRAVRMEPPGGLIRTAGPRGGTAFSNPGGEGLSAITADLSVFPLTANTARLSYRIFLVKDAQHAYEILIDAETGELLFRQNVVVTAAQARVWTKSPLTGTRELKDLPDAWLPAAAMVTTGNNTDSFLDTNGDGIPDNINNSTMLSGRAYNPSRLFDFPFGDGTTGQDPRGFPAAAITNLFWFLNTAHDYFYGLGFTESAANFQTNNFGLGGAGNDAVIAMAQCGAGTNNAWMFTPSDGTPPQMCMGIWTQGTQGQTDDRDSDYDGMIVFHEYTHGVSNRLVGGGNNVTCLGGTQSGAMGEGWSDYFASSFFNDPIGGAYSSGRPQGIRRQSYDGYTFTYEDIGNQGYQVHRDGEIWAATLWDLRKSLGAVVTDQLVINGLKGTICRPSMIDARDAILAADLATNGGANRAKIWEIFAKHGMGYSAAGFDGNILAGTRYDANFDQPPDLQTQRSPAVTSNPLSILGSMGAPYNYNINATNPNGGTLNFALTSGPAGMIVGSSSGAVSWISSFTGQRIKITVTDGMGGRVIHGYLLPVLTQVSAGSPIPISGSNGMSGFLLFNTTANAAPALQTTLRGGTGDADFYVQNPLGTMWGQTFNWDNFETLTFPSVAGGQWFVQVFQYTPYTTTFRADLITPSVLPVNSTQPGLTDVLSGERLYRLTVPPGMSLLKIDTTGGSGNVNLFLKRGSVAVCQEGSASTNFCTFDYRTSSTSTVDSISVANPAAGDWYLDLMGFAGYTNVTLANTVSTGSLTADLTISKTHTGTFVAGQVGATYSITVSNAGLAATSGFVEVVDTLPTWLTATSIGGVGWTCTLANLTCFRSSVLAAGASYEPIILTVNVAANAPASVTNTAVVSGGGDTNTANNTSSDVTAIASANPAIHALAPASAIAGSAGFTLNVFGSSFLNGSTIHWNGSPRPTTWVSLNHVKAPISAADVASAGTAQVSVVNPAPGGPSGNSPFAIQTLSSAQWVEIGTTPVEMPERSSGRVTGIGTHPSDPNTIYIATSGGGVWKTTDGGTSWTPLTDMQNTLSMGSVAVAPSNPNVVYAGTGEASSFSDSNGGKGILVSTDAGATWTLRTGPGDVFQKLAVSKIAVHPTDPNTAYAAISYVSGANSVWGSANAGIWKSTDGGVNWVKRTGSIATPIPWTDVQIDPANPNNVYGVAADWNNAASGVYKSTDGGGTWTLLSNAPNGASMSFLALGLSKSNPQRLYVAANRTASPFGLSQFVRSDNGGATFSDLTAGTPDYLCGGSWGHHIAVHPTNPAIVYAAGGTCPNGVVTSSDSGMTWSAVPGAAAWVYHRSLAIDASGRLLDGTEFGIKRLDSTAPVMWGNLNTNLNTLLFGSVAMHPTAPAAGYGKASATGVQKYAGSMEWQRVDFANYGLIRYAPGNANRLYSSNFGVRRSDDGGITWVDKQVSDNAGWYIDMPMAVDPSNANRVVVASVERIYESVNGGDSWTQIGAVGAGGLPSWFQIACLAMAKTAPDTIYAGGQGVLYVTHNHGTTWTTYTVPGNGRVRDIYVSPTDAMSIVVGVNSFTNSNGHVLKSSNGGQTWIGIGGNLPDLPVWSLQVDPADPNTIFIGADDGVYVTRNGGASWSRFGTGLPNAQVYDIQLNDATKTLTAGTYGRGVWAIRSGAADLSIAKTHTGNLSQGQSGTFTISVTNTGALPTSGTVTVSDQLPASLTGTSITGAGWNCTQPAGPCTRSDALAPGASYPPITLTVQVAQNASSPVVNMAMVSGGGDTNPANNTASDSATVAVPLPESAHPYPNNFDFTWTYTLGTALKASTGKAATITSLNVTFDPQTSVETSNDWIYVMDGNGQNIPGSPFTGKTLAGQTVNVPGATVKIRLLTNARTDDWGFKVTSIVPGGTGTPDLSINKSHSGSFAVGQVGAQYSIVVQNVGTAASSGVVTVTDTVPAGLSATTMGGSGWTCTQPGGPCTRSDVLNAGGSYPAITLTVNVTAATATTVTNTAGVSGGGDTNTANNTALDLTNIVVAQSANLMITKSHVGDFARGQTGAYTISVINSGSGATSGTITVNDNLPAGLAGVSIGGSGWTCIQPAGPCSRNDALAPGTSWPSITLTVQVAANAPSLVVNIATITGGASAADPTNIGDPPTTGCTIESPHPYPNNYDQTWTCTLPGFTSLNVTFDPMTSVDPSDWIYVMDGNGVGIPGSPFTGTALAGQTKVVAGSTVKVRLLTDGRRDGWGLKVTSVTGGGTAGPDLAMSKSHVGNFTRGQTGATYTLTVRNVGTGPTSGQVSVTDTVPAGLTATGISGAGWACTQPAGPCTRSDVLAAGASYPAITLTVSVAADAPNSVSNSATLTGGGDSSTGNNTAVDPTTIEGGGGGTTCDLESPHPYPDNLDQTWTCTVAGNPGSIEVTFDPRTMIESSGDWLYVMDGNGVNIPGSPFTGNALAGQTKTVPGATVRIRLVSDGRRSEWGFKVTSVTAAGPPASDLTITKTHTGNFEQGQQGATYTITVRNVGGGATSGTVSVTDTVPAGLTAATIGGTGWTCVQAAGPCTRSDALAPGASYPPITLTVNVAANAPASVTNTATVSGGGDASPGNNQAFDLTVVTGPQPPCVLPESTHPYPNEFDFTWTCTYPGSPSGLQVTFDPRTSVEFGNDWIYVMDGNGVNIPGSPFTGTTLAGQTKLVPGATVRIRLVTNRRTDGWGFKVTNIVPVAGAGLKP